TVGGAFVGSAFVSKSQICPFLTKPVQYVEFTGFLLDQSAIELTSTPISRQFDNYLRNRLSTDWNAFLSDNCYAGVSAPASVPAGSFLAPSVGILLLAAGLLELQRRKSLLPLRAE